MNNFYTSQKYVTATGTSHLNLIILYPSRPVIAFIFVVWHLFAKLIINTYMRAWGRLTYEAENRLNRCFDLC